MLFAVPAAFTFGNTALLPNTRQCKYLNENISIAKAFFVKERIRPRGSGLSLTTSAVSRTFLTFLLFLGLFEHTSTRARQTPLGPTDSAPSLSISSFSCVFTLFAQPVSVHRLGVAHQPSLRPLWTMMSYSNSLPWGEAGNLINLPVTIVKDHSPLQVSPHEPHRSSVASGHDDRTLRNQSDRAT
jgi:hypothetical protein